jgi:hypothetical protein
MIGLSVVFATVKEGERVFSCDCKTDTEQAGVFTGGIALGDFVFISPYDRFVIVLAFSGVL